MSTEIDWKQEYINLHQQMTIWEKNKYEYLRRLVLKAADARKEDKKEHADYLDDFFEHEVFQGLTGLASLLLDKEKLIRE